MTLHLLDDELEDRGSPSADGKAYAEKVLSALQNEKTRRWEYLRAARRAQVRVPAKKKRGQRGTFMIGHAEFRILHALVERADSDLTNSFPRVEVLAATEGWSIRMVRVLLQSLAKKGWIVRHGDRGTKVNQFCVPAGAVTFYAKGWEGPIRRRPKVAT